MAHQNIQVNLLFFAKSRELAGANNSQIKIPSHCTFKQLLDNIVEKYPSLSVISENVILSLNEEYLSRDSVVDVAAGDEIAVIPPISGG